MIEARGLTKRYGSTVAVNDLSFDVRPGLVTGFLGPNGAGKTTTMRLILGLDHPNKGTVRVDGRRYDHIRFPLHNVGALLDAKAVHGGRRASEHLWSLAQSNGIPRRRVGEVLELVGMNTVARKRVGTFSARHEPTPRDRRRAARRPRHPHVRRAGQRSRP
jgi:ABC-2 type transport system ATP-binding protein